jgi:hypothetical protein
MLLGNQIKVDAINEKVPCMRKKKNTLGDLIEKPEVKKPLEM